LTRERLVASAAVVGGALIAIGAFLPWLSPFAGLHPLRGIIGLNGRLLAAGGVVCLVAGLRCWQRPDRWLQRAVAAVGWALTGFAIWLTIQLFITYRELRGNPMLVPRLGPGPLSRPRRLAPGGRDATATAPADPWWEARRHALTTAYATLRTPRPPPPGVHEPSGGVDLIRARIRARTPDRGN